MKDQIEVKLGIQERLMLKNLTKALNKLAVSMQLYMPQKPKNSEIRLTEPANLDGGGYIAGEMTDEEFAEATRIYESRYGGN